MPAQKAKEIVDGLLIKESHKIVIAEKDKGRVATVVRIIGEM